MVIGCSGAGKSTLSRQLHTILGLELISLDQYYWKPNWTEPDKATWTRTVEKLAEKKDWIIDGSYGGTMDIRIEKADTIIFLNYSTTVCLSRVIKRTIKHWKKVRPGIPEGCRERFDIDFLHYVITYKRKRGRKLVEKLKNLEDSKQVFIFKNDLETSKFLDDIK